MSPIVLTYINSEIEMEWCTWFLKIEQLQNFRNKLQLNKSRLRSFKARVESFSYSSSSSLCARGLYFRIHIRFVSQKYEKVTMNEAA